MKPITVNPFIKFGFLLSQIMLVLMTESNKLIIIIVLYSVLYMIIKRVDIALVVRGLKFGLLLTIFMFVFSLLRYRNLVTALINGIDLIKVYIAMIMVSIVYKMETGNKELAYVLSVIFSPFRVWGYDQNKLYTLFLLILNQIYTMRDSAFRMHKYAKFKANQKLAVSDGMRLIIPFITSNLKHNELLAIGLMNSGYDQRVKKVKPYLLKNYKLGHAIALIVIISLELVILI